MSDLVVNYSYPVYSCHSNGGLARVRFLTPETPPRTLASRPASWRLVLFASGPVAISKIEFYTNGEPGWDPARLVVYRPKLCALGEQGHLGIELLDLFPFLGKRLELKAGGYDNLWLRIHFSGTANIDQLRFICTSTIAPAT